MGFIDDIMYGVEGKSDKENAKKLNQILQQAETWRLKHGAQFEPSKYVLVHFTRNTKRTTEASLKINGTMINPAKEARYLGVTLDQKLNFKSHLQNIAKKGTKAAMALARIAKTNWGAPFKYAKQLFNAVIAPRTDYAACIWHRPSNKARYSAQIRTLTTIQRIAMKSISGCFRTTPTAALENETGLPPAWIRLRSKVLQAITRMQTLSEKHPVHEWLQKARITRTSSISHRSNLENIMQQFPHTASKTEFIEPFIRPPWWLPKAQITIAETKDDAKAMHDKILQNTCLGTTRYIYTDGSGIQGKIGAATFEPATNTATQQHLGGENHFNVFAAEASALATAAELALHSNWPKRNIIFTDSQAAAKAVDNPWRQSGQSIIK